MAPRASVIVVTRNRREELLRTLEALARQQEPFELVVVDNGSSDGSPRAVRESYPDAVLLELPDNAGACGGRNRGIAAASGDVLVFLDDDAEPAAPDALSRILARFERDARLGIVAANSHLAATGEPERDAIPRRDKRLPGGDCEVSYFCAVGFAVRREVLEQIGGFTEDFVYLAEELDLAWRVIAGGWRIVWLSDLVVLHRRSVLERPHGRWVYSNMRNRVRLAVTHLPLRYVLSYAVLWWPWLLAHALRHGTIGDFLRGLRDFLRLLPTTCRRRRVLSRETLAMIDELDGRLLY
jgi:GT2 family glycosyltransferase